MPAADDGPPTVTPSVSGVPVPSAYLRVLPALLQPLAVSEAHWVPFHSIRTRVPSPLLTAHSTPGVELPLPS